MARMRSMRDDKHDDHALRHGADTHIGESVGDTTKNGTFQYGQPCPMFFTPEGATLALEGSYRGCSCFLIGGGPSLTKLNLELLKQPGVVTFGMNNSVKAVRPDLWTCVDDPSRFLYSIWLDPRITKFVPQAHFNKPLWMSTHVDGKDHWQKGPRVPRDCPNMVGYRRNEKFAAHRFLTENTINWGCHKDFGGCRSVMLAALRITHLLGFRKVFLLGVDLSMSASSTYAFAEGRTKGAVKNNTNTYERMVREYFPALKPVFDAAGLEVFNCNPDSGLKIFPHMAFNDAVKYSNREIGDTTKERTEGMYLKFEEKVRLVDQASAYAATRGEKQAVDD